MKSSYFYPALKRLIASGLMLCFVVACPLNQDTQKPSEVESEFPEWKIAAQQMVKRQIVSRGVRDPKVIQVMETTPRHLFVPENSQTYAYIDRPLPIGEGQTISQPYIVALMTELLHLRGTERVLEIGTGSGYQAAVLAQLAKEVYSIEIVKVLADSARARLQRLGYQNVHVMWGDGYQGWPAYAPFDAIIVTAAPPEVPPALLEQLKDNGRLVIPVGGIYQELKLLTKTKTGLIKTKSIIPVRFVPMVHPEKPLLED